MKGNRLTSKVGSVHYISPEVLVQSYTEKCDIWSAGVILYLLLIGKIPFYGKDEAEIFSKIKNITYNMDDSSWKNISNEAKDLIKHIFVPENQRFTAKEVLSHPWFKIINISKENKLNIDFNFFKKYSEENSLKKIALYFTATRLNKEEIKELKQTFKNFDISLDGQISYEEFEKGFIEYQKINSSIFNQNEIRNIFDSVDINKNGKIDYSEFIAASLENRKEIVERRLLEAFSSYDKDETGKINKEDFFKALHIDVSLNLKGLDKIIDDLMKDNLIDYNEFLKIINK